MLNPSKLYYAVFVDHSETPPEKRYPLMLRAIEQSQLDAAEKAQWLVGGMWDTTIIYSYLHRQHCNLFAVVFTGETTRLTQEEVLARYGSDSAKKNVEFDMSNFMPSYLHPKVEIYTTADLRKVAASEPRTDSGAIIIEGNGT